LEGSEGPKGNSESFLNGLTSSWQSSRINQIENYTKVDGNGTAMRDGIKMDARIEVTPKYGYRIGN